MEQIERVARAGVIFGRIHACVITVRLSRGDSVVRHLLKETVALRAVDAFLNDRFAV